MVAIDIADIRKGIVDPDAAKKFASGFLSAYAATAFGVMPKSEIDILIFSLLVNTGLVDPNASLFRTARALNITPSKARSLLFQYQLRHVSQDQTDHEVIISLRTARYWKEGDKLCFGVASPLVRAAISAKMQEAGVFAEVSLSGEILKVNPPHFGNVVRALLPKIAGDRLIKHLAKTKILDENAARKAFDDYAGMVAGEAIKAGTSEAFEKFVSGIGDLVTDHGPATLEALSQLIT